MVNENSDRPLTSEVGDRKSPQIDGPLAVGILVLTATSLVMVPNTGIFGIVFGLTGWLVFFDARCAGICNRGDMPLILRMNPLGWGVSK